MDGMRRANKNISHFNSSRCKDSCFGYFIGDIMVLAVAKGRSVNIQDKCNT